MRFYFLLLFALLPFLFSFSPTSEPTTVAELQAQYRLLVDLQANKEISAPVFETRAEALQLLVKERFNLSLEDLAMEQVVTAQRVNWLASALYFGSALLVFMLLGPLLHKFWQLLRALLKKIWHLAFIRKLLRQIARLLLLIWEPLAYMVLIASLWLLNNEWVLVLGSLSLGILISYSTYSRRKADTEKQSVQVASWTITIVWAALAYYFDHAWIGFMAVGAFVSSMCFVLVMLPRMIGLGFKEDKSSFVIRLTTIMFVLTALSLLIFHTNYLPFLSQLRHPLRVYEVGLLSLVPLVYFLGLGFTAFFTFGRKAAVYKQVLVRIISFAIGCFSIAVGLFYGVGSLFWIGLFFMLWFTVDLFLELIYRKIDVVWSGLFLAAILGATGYWLKTNLSVVLEFALSLGW